jgi:hypothetical protein
MYPILFLFPFLFPVAGNSSSLFPSAASAPGRVGTPSGSYVVLGIVPTSGCEYAQPNVRGSQSWYIREVKLNGAALTQNVDYTVIDDGSNKGTVQFSVTLQRGDQVQISGPTLEPGAHGGNIWFE